MIADKEDGRIEFSCEGIFIVAKIKLGPSKLDNLFDGAQEIPLSLLICDQVADVRSGQEIVAASVALRGLDSTFPLLVIESPIKDDTFIVIDGRKRLIAAEAQGFKVANCVVLPLNLTRARELARAINSLSQQAVSKFPLGLLLVQYFEAGRKDGTGSARKGLAISKETKKLLIMLTNTSNRTLERAAAPMKRLYFKKKEEFKKESISETLGAFATKYPRSALALFLDGKISVNAFAKNWESEIYSRRKAESTTKEKTEEQSEINRSPENSIASSDEEQKKLSRKGNGTADCFSKLKELLCFISPGQIISEDLADQIYDFLRRFPKESSNLIWLAVNLERFRRSKNLSYPKQKSKKAKSEQTQILF